LDAKRISALTAVTLASVVAFLSTSDVLSLDERFSLIVLIVAAGLWTTEAVPLVATSLLIPLLQAILGVQSFKAALRPFFDPVVMLLLGGFLLAIAVEKQDLDEYLAYQILSRLKADARFVVLAIMATTAFLSMWISNTASTALMLTIALKFTDEIEDRKGNFSKIMVLSIAYSATAGGLSTLFGLPITIFMIVVIWMILFVFFPTDVKSMPSLSVEIKSLNSKQKLTFAVFFFSLLLWLTGKLPEPIALVIGWPGHGLSSSVVAAIIAVFLLMSGLVDERDIPRANWNTLLLIGGGLSLGAALETSGLVVRISDGLLSLTGGRSELVIISLVAAFGLGISIIASNTASAGIFLPIAIGLGLSTGMSPVILAVVVGITTSLDFMLPVGTPPNAIAYSTGKVKMGEMIKVGIILDLVGVIVTIALAYFLWPLLI
jgi:sodium-dependent dicarboxylate transporter 2/3/5